jgi:hypothetical protein
VQEKIQRLTLNLIAPNSCDQQISQQGQSSPWETLLLRGDIYFFPSHLLPPSSRNKASTRIKLSTSWTPNLWKASKCHAALRKLGTIFLHHQLQSCLNVN